MAIYKRCPDAKGDACGTLAQTKGRGTVIEGDHNHYKICSSPTGCKKTDDTDCKCFVLAMHVEVNEDHPKGITTEEFPYPGQRTQPETEMLSVDMINEKYPGKAVKGHAKDYWEIECRCLAVDKDGKPIKT